MTPIQEEKKKEVMKHQSRAEEEKKGRRKKTFQRRFRRRPRRKKTEFQTARNAPVSFRRWHFYLLTREGAIESRLLWLRREERTGTERRETTGAKVTFGRRRGLQSARCIPSARACHRSPGRS